MADERTPPQSAGAADERTPLLRPREPAKRDGWRAPADELSLARRSLIIACTDIPAIVAALDMTATATLQTAIGSEFRAQELASWIGAAYFLGVCAFTPLYGRLVDVLGRRLSYALATSLIFLGVLGCALAQSMPFLIAARLLSGIGAAGVETIGSVIASDLFAPKDRGIVYGAVNLAWGAGLGLGGPLGGHLNDAVGWRSAFGLQLPVIALAILLNVSLVRYAIPSDAEPNEEIRHSVDWLGTLALFVALAGALVAVSMKADRLFAFASAPVLAPLAASMLALAALVLIESTAANAILPPSLMRRRNVAALLASGCLHAFACMSLIFFFPPFFHVVQDLSTSAAGVALVPAGLAIAIGPLIAGAIISQTGKVRTLMLLCLGPTLVPLAATAFMSRPWPTWACSLLLLPVALGFAGAVACQLVSLVASVPRREIPVASGAFQLSRAAGEAFGVGCSGAALQGALGLGLGRHFRGTWGAGVVDRIRHAASAIRDLPPGDRLKALAAYEHALRAVFALNFFVALVAFIISWRVQDVPLDDDRDEDEPAVS